MKAGSGRSPGSWQTVRPQLSGLLGEMGIRNEEDAYTDI